MKKWYLQTWFIALMFSLWFFWIPLVIGIVLLFMQRKELNRLNNSYGTYDELQSKISSLYTEYTKKEEMIKAEFSKKEEDLQDSFSEKEALFDKKLSNLQ